VRHDLADVFCTTSEGVRGQRALDWRLVDAIAKPGVFAGTVDERARALAATSARPEQARGVALPPIARRDEPDGLAYRHVRVEIDREQRTASFTIVAPTGEQPGDVAGIEAAGAGWWPLAMGRELDDAILCMRTNETEIGTWLLRTEGSPAAVLAADRLLAEHREHWFVRETIGLLRRTLARLDVSSRSMFALVEPGSCFAGLLAELAFAADRGYMLALPDEPERAPGLVLTES